ncbi:hypothetical protein U1839_10390 [Sphingomonas sp. RT2P30]|uniref:hypothetical protein n=1 Tax=Parasphingomonas halimpatiens TaxID=3096162 RepID=UPI002FC8F85C
MTRSLINRLDDIAYLTGIPQLSKRLAKQQQRRRHLRWWPIVALTIATIGLCVSFVSAHPAIGFALLVMVQGCAGFLSLFGPVKPLGAIEGVDERDIQVRRSAYLFGFAVVSLVLNIGIGLVIALGFFALWSRDALLDGLMALWLYAIILVAKLPTLYASWASRPIDEE